MHRIVEFLPVQLCSGPVQIPADVILQVVPTVKGQAENPVHLIHHIQFGGAFFADGGNGAGVLGHHFPGFQGNFIPGDEAVAQCEEDFFVQVAFHQLHIQLRNLTGGNELGAVTGREFHVLIVDDGLCDFFEAHVGLGIAVGHGRVGEGVAGADDVAAELDLLAIAALTAVILAEAQQVHFRGGLGGTIEVIGDAQGVFVHDPAHGPGGGGGGGVVTGIVYKISKGDEISVVVGAGGVGGVTSGKYANGIWSGSSGGNSSFSVGGVNYVTAIGGGGDGGFRMPGKVGGSSAGSRSDKANDTTLSPSPVQPLINTNGISFYESFGSKGGDGLNSCFYASAGGGGACGSGHSPISDSRAGDGGEGLRCAITGETLVYGSGGGGGGTVVTPTFTLNKSIHIEIILFTGALNNPLYIIIAVIPPIEISSP